MTVLDKNHKSREEPVDNFARGYRPVGKQTAAQIEPLYCDIQRLLEHDTSLTPARIAEAAGLSSQWIVRGIRKPNWHAKNATQLFRVEAALSKHPSWHPKRILGEEDRDSPTSYVYRRWVDPESAPEFHKDFLRWQNRQSDMSFIKTMRDDPWVSILDVSAPVPADYRFLDYADGIAAHFPFSKKGKRLGDHQSQAYADLTSKDFGDLVKGGVPRCKDMVHINKSQNDRVVFRSIGFPCRDENLVVSKMKLEHWIPGRLKFNTPRDGSGG
jgi:hypothetical protein